MHGTGDLKLIHIYTYLYILLNQLNLDSFDKMAVSLQQRRIQEKSTTAAGAGVALSTIAAAG